MFGKQLLIVFLHSPFPKNFCVRGNVLYRAECCQTYISLFVFHYQHNYESNSFSPLSTVDWQSIQNRIFLFPRITRLFTLGEGSSVCDGERKMPYLNIFHPPRCHLMFRPRPGPDCIQLVLKAAPTSIVFPARVLRIAKQYKAQH